MRDNQILLYVQLHLFFHIWGNTHSYHISHSSPVHPVCHCRGPQGFPLNHLLGLQSSLHLGPGGESRSSPHQKLAGTFTLKLMPWFRNINGIRIVPGSLERDQAPVKQVCHFFSFNFTTQSSSYRLSYFSAALVPWVFSAHCCISSWLHYTVL